jgi:acyl-CoA reductase-like NAD-dependent aldehyde dehydrogenase
VLQIAAWSYPLLVVINALLPSVLAGNAVLLKHAPRTALSAETFARLFVDAGAPEGLVQALHADHATCAELIARDEIGYVAFIGSVRGGREVSGECAKRFLDVGLELPGKDPVYLAPDANLEHAIVNVVDGAMYNAGQSCSGVKRIYVHESLYKEFVEGAEAEAKKLILGDPLLASTSMGPMALPEAPARLLAVVEEARAKGGRIVCGGKPASEQGLGRFFEPTLIADATHAMRGLMIDEVFGPVVGICKVKSDDEAVLRMNDSPFGLTAAVWTQDQTRAFHLGAQLQAGTFFMNRCDYTDSALPWTGVKNSGRGVSLSRYGFLSITRRKSFNLRTQT